MDLSNTDLSALVQQMDSVYTREEALLCRLEEMESIMAASQDMTKRPPFFAVGLVLGVAMASVAVLAHGRISPLVGLALSAVGVLLIHALGAAFGHMSAKRMIANAVASARENPKKPRGRENLRELAALIVVLKAEVACAAAEQTESPK